jgi:hypothetical protein
MGALDVTVLLQSQAIVVHHAVTQKMPQIFTPAQVQDKTDLKAYSKSHACKPFTPWYGSQKKLHSVRARYHNSVC